MRVLEGRDFNAKTEREERRIRKNLKKGEGKKKLKDKKINREERKLCRFLKDIGQY